MPRRRCVGCGLTRDKGYLVRFVSVEGRLVPDFKKRMPGRGLYLCPSRGCVVSACEKKGAFSRALRTAVTVPDTEELWEEIPEGSD
ncbi:MAG: YlxR family protein [Thermodesulfobacteriota bacterium]